MRLGQPVNVYKRTTLGGFSDFLSSFSDTVGSLTKTALDYQTSRAQTDVAIAQANATIAAANRPAPVAYIAPVKSNTTNMLMYGGLAAVAGLLLYKFVIKRR
jgi:hypothetical protein